MYNDLKILIMKKNYLWRSFAFIMATMLSLGFMSCGHDSDPDPELKASPSSIKLAAIGGESVDVSITCNTSWIVEVDEDWVEVSPTYGNGDDIIEVSAKDNPDDAKRTSTIIIKAGNIERKVKVTQDAGQSLSVSPQNPNLSAEKGASGSFTITANSTWNITGVPSWLSLSATQGNNTTTITMTTTEMNFDDVIRTASLSITAGTKSTVVTVTQEPMFDSTIKVSVSNELILSNGYYTDLTFNNVLGYHEGFYYRQAFDVKTEEDIYNEVIEGNPYPSKEYNFTYAYGLNASTNYVYCCVPYSGDSKSRKYGKMLVQKFSTKSNSTYCDAATSLSYNSSYWTYTISKQQRCHHYYKLMAKNSAAETYSEYPPVLLACLIRDRINDKEHYPNYDYFLNDGTSRETRSEGDYAFLIWTWGVDDNNEFSGNIRGSYANLSSSVLKTVSQNHNGNALKSIKKYTRSEIDNLKKYLIVEETGK